MLKLSKKLEYGLIALRHLMRQPKDHLTNVKEISQLYRSSFDLTAKVLQQLAAADWVHAEHGVKGGYCLKIDLKAVSFLELIEVLMGPVHLVACLEEEEGECQLLGTCNVIEPLKKLDHRLKEFYKTILVVELLEEESGMSEHNFSKESFCV